MPFFKRTPKPPAQIPPDALHAGEEVERSVRATLVQGKRVMNGGLYMTGSRLLFHADKGDARWLVVPFDEIGSSGLYPAPTTAMGAPRLRAHCLFVETTKGEHVWWDFADDEERAWLQVVQGRTAHQSEDPTSDD